MSTPPTDKCLMCGIELISQQKFFFMVCRNCKNYKISLHNKEVEYMEIVLDNVVAQFHFYYNSFYFKDLGFNKISSTMNIPTFNWHNKDQVIQKLNSLLTFL